MIRNNLKIAWRKLLKRKVYSVVTITSLTIGIAACLLIGTMVTNELSYDKNWDKTDDVYRIIRKDSVSGKRYERTLDGFGKAIKNKFPEIEASSSITTYSEWFSIEENNTQFKVDALYAESDIWNILDFDVLEGDPKNFQVGYANLIISEKIKDLYFPNSNPINKKIIKNVPFYNDAKQFIITGVIKNIPTNTHLRSDVIVINESKDKEFAASGFGFFQTQFVTLKSNTNTLLLSEKVNKWYDNLVNDNSDIYSLQPIKDIYLHSEFSEGQEIKGSIRDVYIFSAIALLLLLIGCINFVNLSTARALGNKKETGVRKFLGASKKALVWLYLTESLLYFAISFIFSVISFLFGLPLLTAFLGYDLPITILNNFNFFAITIGFVFLLSLLIGLYPALLLSKIKPVRIIKNKITTSQTSGYLRKSLVAVQFALAIGLLIAAMVVNNQLNYVNSKDLGYDKNNLLKIDLTQWESNAMAFKKEVEKIPGVENSSITSWVPSYGGGNMSRQTQDPNNPNKTLTIWYIDADRDFTATTNMKLLGGRFLNRASDTPNLETAGNDWDKIEEIQSQQNVLITEHTAKMFGITQLNQHNDFINATPVGIIANFHNESLKNPLLPTVIRSINPNTGNMLLRVNTENRQAIVGQIQEIYKSFFPEKIFGYSWVDEDLDKQYAKDMKMESLFELFSGLIIFLSCMGLFGLVTYEIETRVKEIGVRKVLGASVFNITKLFSIDFLKIIVLAGIFATPIIWIIMNKWLQDYAYRIQINGWYFLAATLCAIVIALATVSYKTIKAASANPVKNLRTE